MVRRSNNVPSDFSNDEHRAALFATDGVIAQAAQVLGVTRSALSTYYSRHSELRDYARQLRQERLWAQAQQLYQYMTQQGDGCSLYEAAEACGMSSRHAQTLVKSFPGLFRVYIEVWRRAAALVVWKHRYDGGVTGSQLKREAQRLTGARYGASGVDMLHLLDGPNVGLLVYAEEGDDGAWRYLPMPLRDRSGDYTLNAWWQRARRLLGEWWEKRAEQDVPVLEECDGARWGESNLARRYIWDE